MFLQNLKKIDLALEQKMTNTTMKFDSQWYSSFSDDLGNEVIYSFPGYVTKEKDYSP